MDAGTTINDTISDSEINELNTRRNSLLSYHETKIEKLKQEIELANKIIEQEKEENDKILNIMIQAGQKKEIRIDFESRFNDFRRQNETIAKISKENKYSKRGDSYLENIYKKSKHNDGLLIYHEKQNKTKEFKSQLMKGQIKPNAENLDSKIKRLGIEYKDVFKIINDQNPVDFRESLILKTVIPDLATTNQQDQHEIIPTERFPNPYEKVFPMYDMTERRPDYKKISYLGLDDHINFSEDLFNIKDTGDYEQVYKIKDKTKELSKYINHNSIIGDRNFLYNETTYANYKDLTRYARDRTRQSVNLKGVLEDDYIDHYKATILEKEQEGDFEWSDILLEPEKNIDKRLRSLRFDDMINIISGKISDYELHEKIHDKRPIKTLDEMTGYLSNLAVNLEARKAKRIVEKKQKQAEDEINKNQFKKGFGTMLLMEVNKKTQDEEILNVESKIDKEKYQTIFNQFLINNKIQPKTSGRFGESSSSEQEKTVARNIASKNLGTSNEMIEEIIVEIDVKIENKMKELLSMAQTEPRKLNMLIDGMLQSDDPAQTKLAMFLAKYQVVNQEIDMEWMRDPEKQSNHDYSIRSSPIKQSPNKSVVERFSPIRLREF